MRLRMTREFRSCIRALLRKITTCVFFPDGESFLDAFALKKPALVLLDIMLPDMDGYSILVKIRERDERMPGYNRQRKE